MIKITFGIKKSRLQSYKTNCMRPKARASFIKLINKNLYDNYCNCYLKSKWNYFAKKITRTKWTGLFQCIDCNKLFRTKLMKVKGYSKLICEIAFVSYLILKRYIFH